MGEGGVLKGLFIRIFLGIPLSLETRMLLSSRYPEDTSHIEDVTTCFREKGWGGEKGS